MSLTPEQLKKWRKAFAFGISAGITHADALVLCEMAERYAFLRDDPRADVRIIGVGKRSGVELDTTIDELIK